MHQYVKEVEKCKKKKKTNIVYNNYNEHYDIYCAHMKQ